MGGAAVKNAWHTDDFPSRLNPLASMIDEINKNETDEYAYINYALMVTVGSQETVLLWTRNCNDRE